MALPIDSTDKNRDPRALKILAKSIYRELRGGGYAERDVLAFAGELLSLVSSDVKERREGGGGETLERRQQVRSVLPRGPVRGVSVRSAGVGRGGRSGPRSSGGGRGGRCGRGGLAARAARRAVGEQGRAVDAV